MSNFGGLKSLQDVTRAKFGQPGVDAITNYPHLVSAQIDNTLYMKEEGKARPATSFSLHKGSNDKLVKSGVSGREVVRGTGCAAAYDRMTGFPCGVMFSPGGRAAAPTPAVYVPPAVLPYPATAKPPNTMLIVGVAAVVLLIVVIAMRGRQPAYGPPRGRGGYGGGGGGGGGGRGGYGYKKRSKKRKK